VSPEIFERSFEEAIECALLQYGPDACAGDSTAVREQFLKRLAPEIERRGALDVLRNGLKDSGCKLRLAYFRRLKELRTALISAAVTGKIDVRD
jgi:hypothetical protein